MITVTVGNKLIMFKLKSYIKSTFLTAFVSLAGGSLTSCVSEDIAVPDIPRDSQFEGKKLAVLPLGISFEVANNTRDMIYGDDFDHAIDFDTPNECYAIFFKTENNQKIVKYITPLYYNQQLTEKYQPSSPTPTAEYTVYAVAYVPCDDIKEDDIPEKLTHVLVVLNGGPVYNKFHDLVYDPSGNVNSDITDSDILQVTWSNPLNTNELVNMDLVDENEVEHYDYFSDGVIGRNIKNYYTMTNSAYFKDGKLMTLAEINGNGFVSIDDFIAAKNSNHDALPTAQVTVERMVAKFSAPLMPTEIIGGEERFFRPSTSVPKLVVYSWEGNELRTREIDWRIHLLGWTINGLESENYVFKNISNVDYPQWPLKQWNKPDEKRSYWSEDPHYNKYSDEDTYFYPRQLRKAADTPNLVSLSAGVNNMHKKKPALTYQRFNEITWSPSFIVAPENTYNPDPTIDWNLDNHEAQLVGPHLLLTAELYFQDGRVPGVYLSGFGKEEHLYSDRLQRYYFSEADWFKMFVREFNKTLATQNNMSFQLLNLDHPDTKWNCRLSANPTGDCRLFYRHLNSLWNNWTEKDPVKTSRLREEAISIEDPENDPNATDKYFFTEITFDMIDLLDEGVGTFSTQANILQGDGRVMPWLPNIKIKQLNYNEKGDLELKRLEFEVSEGSVPNDELDENSWSDEMYKSIFREWFGPVDHFLGGRMYYSGAIKHQTITGSDNDDSNLIYFGTVRNHWYKFSITAINGVGTPVSDPNQWIIPDKYGYNDQIAVQMDVLRWHPKSSFVGLGE